MPFRRFALLHIYVCFETEEMAVHVAMNPPMAPTVEQDFVSELNRANAIIDQLIRTSLDVIPLIEQLRQRTDEFEIECIRHDLEEIFKAAMSRGNITAEIVLNFANMLAFNSVRDIQIRVAKPGDSIVIYFLCENVKSLCKLGQMITSGFMHSVFAPAIEFLARRPTTVDVYVRANEFYFTLLCLSSPADKG